jgi:hypothetical protein
VSAEVDHAVEKQELVGQPDGAAAVEGQAPPAEVVTAEGVRVPVRFARTEDGRRLRLTARLRDCGRGRP